MRTSSHWITAAMVSLSLTVTACDDGDKDSDPIEEADTDTDTDADTDADADCASLDVDACAANSNCLVIEGRPLSTNPTTSEPCVDFDIPLVPFGCMDTKGGCGDAETIAGAAVDECDHWFSSTCIPNGWSACDFGSYGECP
ncbi:MAG: hypothetical protein AAFV53_32040 [Myxococcota bacterium]